MSDVVLTIGGRDYSVACAAGEEAHIAELGRMIDDKLGTLAGAAGKNARSNAGQNPRTNARTNDGRSLLFAALLLADELYELRHAAPGQPPAAPSPDTLGLFVPPDQLEALAERLEALADVLEVPA